MVGSSPWHQMKFGKGKVCIELPVMLYPEGKGRILESAF